MDTPTPLNTLVQCNLWTAVYASAMATGLTPETACEHADLAVKLMTERMPCVPSQHAFDELRKALDELRERVMKMGAERSDPAPTNGGK